MAKKKSPNEASKTPPSLSARPEAKAFQIDQLLRQVGEGAIRIPHFQRPLNWDDSDRLTLFDSIYRGYPIGTLLFWKKSAPAQSVYFGTHHISANERSDALWVVDGQQRITTLAEALLRAPIANERAIFFDLEGEAFVYKRIAEVRPAEPRIPVAKLLDSNDLLEWLLERPTLPAELRHKAIDAGKRIREYQVPSYIVTTDQEKILQTVFLRINQTGHRLKDKDVFHALFASQSPEKPSDLKTLGERLVSLGFGLVPENEILNALRAVNGLPLHHDFADALEPTQAPELLTKTDSALRKAIEFLIKDAQIPHFDLLPYKLPLAVLAKFFYLFPDSNSRSRILLRRWLWRGALAQRHTGATLGLQHHLDLLQKQDEEGSVQELLKLAGSGPAPGVDDIDEFHFNNARSKMQSIALASLTPLHAETRNPVDVGKLLSEANPQTIPKLIQTKGSGLANRILHPPLKTPSELIKALQVTQSRAVLISHGMSKAAQQHLREDEFDAFLKLRGEELQKIVKQFFQKQAEWEADDSPSLSSMMIEEE